MTALREHLNLFALALHRATVLRVGTASEADEESLRASDAHLPGAGWVVGLAGVLAFALTGLLLRGSGWAPGVAAVAATMATATLTHARGETALFRAAERLQAGPSGLGTLVLMLAVAGKLALLAAIASLSEPGVLATIFAGQATSRLAPLLLARSLDGNVLPRSVRVGALWCIVPLALVVATAGPASFALGALAATLACYGMWRLARRQADSAHGDLLASAQQVCELAFCFGVAVGL